jgi:hypothetical protein
MAIDAGFYPQVSVRPQGCYGCVSEPTLICWEFFKTFGHSSVNLTGRANGFASSNPPIGLLSVGIEFECDFHGYGCGRGSRRYQAASFLASATSQSCLQYLRSIFRAAWDCLSVRGVLRPIPLG